MPLDALMEEYKKISKYGMEDGDKAIAQVSNTDWYLQNAARSKFHQDKKLPGIELKLVNIDGREAVYNSKTCLLITQDDIMGTYNYFNGSGVPSWIDRPNKGNDLLHGMYDVLPYILWGTTPKDAQDSTMLERLLKIL